MLDLAEVGPQGLGRRFQSNAALVRLGRRADLEVCVTGAGVWDVHAEIELLRDQGFLVRPVDKALVSVNQQPIREHRLKSGEVITLGSVQLQFGIATARQRSLSSWETLVWVTIIGVTAAAALSIWAIGS